MIDPKSTLSGATPVLRESSHLFVQLEKLHEFLASWVESSDALQSEVANYLKGHFLADELRDWDISRPAPYFGFEIPDSPGNYWYVWFDAPIGYIASTQQWCDAERRTIGRLVEERRRAKSITSSARTSPTFTPVLARDAEDRRIQLAHQGPHPWFLDRGWGEDVQERRARWSPRKPISSTPQPSYLRYFYATKLTPRVEDMDLGIDEFADKVNSDLVGKVVNLASRVGKFANAPGLSPQYPDDGGLFAKAAAGG